MADPRFYHSLGPVELADLARAAGAELLHGGEGVRLSGAAPLAEASADDLAFLEAAPGTDTVPTRAGACFVRARDVLRLPAGTHALVVAQPRAAFARSVPALVRLRRHDASAPAHHPTALIEDGATIGPGTIIGPDARIGRGTRVAANAVIGPGVAIGRDCTIGPGATLQCALLGDGVQVGANAVIGDAGFGVALGAGAPVDVPQLGRVIIQNGVTLGALVCVDRGAFGDTVIGEGTKIDNLCQIAHNCRLGRGVIMAAQVGLSGSVTIEDGVILGGQVGIADHTIIGKGAVLMAKAGVFGDIPAGEMWGGYPARPRTRWLREAATVSRLAKAARRRGGNEGDGA